MRGSLTKGALVAATTLFMATSAFAQDAPTKGGTLVFSLSQAPRTLNNAIQSGSATDVPAAQLFASPLRFDESWNPQPYLAEKWELSPDQKTLTLHIRHNAFFHDGTPITSEDVAFSVLLVRDHHPFKTMLESVESVDTPDQYTAVIRMKEFNSLHLAGHVTALYADPSQACLWQRRYHD